MQFLIPTKCAIILGALLSTAHGAPTESNGVQCFNKRDAINDCGDSTFHSQGSGGSPKFADCQQLTRNIAGGGSWTVPDDEQKALAKYGTCAFGVNTHDAIFGKVGNQDIIDLINTSIQKFARNDGLVGAKGRMTCQGETDDGVIADWGLYHT